VPVLSVIAKKSCSCYSLLIRSAWYPAPSSVARGSRLCNQQTPSIHSPQTASAGIPCRSNHPHVIILPSPIRTPTVATHLQSGAKDFFCHMQCRDGVGTRVGTLWCQCGKVARSALAVQLQHHTVAAVTLSSPLTLILDKKTCA
jgi:hypothetical protein